MTEPTRWVVVDDRDSRITYSGSWTTPNGNSFNNRGNFGAVYRNTLHESSTAGSTMSFTFTGESLVG